MSKRASGASADRARSVSEGTQPDPQRGVSETTTPEIAPALAELDEPPLEPSAEQPSTEQPLAEVGDSISCGYGNEGANLDCMFTRGTEVMAEALISVLRTQLGW
jgi:hypothetical protein